MFGDIIQPTHLLFILVVALIVLGPKRLPEVGRSLGRGLRDFRSAMSGVQDEAHEMLRMDPLPADDTPDYSDSGEPDYDSGEPDYDADAAETDYDTAEDGYDSSELDYETKAPDYTPGEVSAPASLSQAPPTVVTADRQQAEAISSPAEGHVSAATGAVKREPDEHAA